MSAYELLRFLLKWKWLILFGPLLAGGYAAYSVLQNPPRYTAESKILIERNRTPIQVGTGTEQVPALGMLEVMNTEVEIVRSRAVIAGAVDHLGSQPKSRTQEDAGFMTDVRGALQRQGLIQDIAGREGLIEELSSRIRATPVPDSNVFTISMSGDNPRELARTVNAVTDSYLRHRLGVYQAQGRSHDFEIQSQRAFERLNQLRRDLDEYRAANDLAGIAELRASLSFRGQALSDQIATLLQEESSLRQRFLDRHPSVIDVRERIATAERGLASVQQEMRRVEAHASRVRSLEAEIAGQENAYNLAKLRLDEQIARESASPAAANALVIEYADEPVLFAAARLHVILFGVLGGLALAIAIAMLREFFDGRVHEPAQAEEALGMPVVGTVGRFRVPRRGFRDGGTATS